MRHIVCSAVLACAVVAPAAFAATGRADLTATGEVPVQGQAQLLDTDGGLRVAVRLTQAPPGQHGFHIHEFGACGEAGKAAGPHYNPEGMPHGDLAHAGLQGAHAGDFGNLEVGPDGTAVYERVFPGLQLADGEYTVAGRALILHANQDDFSQPSGNAGGRIGCGTIIMTEH